ncbi:MAG: Trk system potassium transporter TrkA [Muribaculaceae bacterium]|nr:Trk system potassium transporter TrkA [Muribaculaceae bacterium]MBR5377641.1 Trk system potassium transporter TrkA [Bacteroidales bacterium]
MNIIIAGDGEVGMHLAEALVRSNHNITIVDPHEELLKMMESHSDLMTITGDSTSTAVLQRANVKKADLLMAVLHDEHINLLTGIIAKKLGAKKVIARVNTMENLSPEVWRMYQDLGIDGLLSPEDIAAQEIISLLKKNASSETYDFAGGNLQLFMVKLEPEAEILGKTVDEVIDQYEHIEFRIAAIHRRQSTFVPQGDEVFQVADMVYVVTKPHAIKDIIKLSGKKHINVHNVMIVGGGRVGRITAKRLEKELNIKILEIDKERCMDLTNYLSEALVVNADARNLDLLEDEGIKDMDAFIAVTDNTETNILTCLQAKSFGVKKTIALVENIDYIDISQNIGIDSIINKKLIAASYMVKYTLGAKVSTLKSLSGIDADIVEFEVRAGSAVTRKPIGQLAMPNDAIICGVTRDGESFIATDDFQIETDDQVVVLALPAGIPAVERLFH